MSIDDLWYKNAVIYFLQWRSGDAIMLAEANVPPDESMNYFGEDGERIQMMLNVAEQRRDPHSLLNWTERMLRTRKECPEVGWGEFTVLRSNVPEVLAMRYDWRRTSLLTLHNFADHPVRLKLKVRCPNDRLRVDSFDGRHSRATNDGTHRITMDAYAWRWFRVGGADHTLDRSDLNVTGDETVR